MKIPGTCINNFIKLGAPSSVSFFISIMVVCTPCWSEFRELEPVAESVSSPSSAKCNELDDPKLSAASLLFELMPCRCNFRVTDPVLLVAVDDCNGFFPALSSALGVSLKALSDMLLPIACFLRSSERLSRKYRQRQLVVPLICGPLYQHLSCCISLCC